MRDIKFRAWSKIEKVMFNIGGFANMDYTEDNQYRYVTIARSSIGVIKDTTPQITTLELMQYTGLKDKNGDEIYEGDIVVAHHKKTDDYFIDRRIVEWRGAGFNISGSHFAQYEVIGNIYENKELLNER